MKVMLIKIKCFFVLLILLSISADAKPLFTWSQVTSNDKLSVRVVVPEGENCPIVNVDGKKLEMTVRAFPQKGVFDDKVCELLVPQTSEEIFVDGMEVPVINKEIRKIAIIADTGCIVSFWRGKLYQQRCTSSEEWPLKKILSNIAQHYPDLIVHVGDYLYRAGKCVDVEKCGNVRGGDNSEAWKADWLGPSVLIADKAPFLFVRGNHENCDRSYMGWFRYLDPHQYPSSSDKCNNFTDSWMFNASRLNSGNLDFYVFDSSFGDEKNVLDSDIQNLKEQFLPLLKSKSSNIWFLTHRPLWSYSTHIKGGDIYYGNVSQKKAFGDLFPDNVSVVLSGHMHLSQVLDLESTNKEKYVPMQIIAGNGGALLHGVPEDKLLFKNVRIGDVIANTITNELDFGFAIVTMQEPGLTGDVIVTLYNASGKEVRQFHVQQ
ncbi:metallophosphoesterase [Ehrlichia canis]|uniref:Metallophosphoesterase n=2 Tax=Ehrlichia canis TaxID=944 RepID=A0ACA6AV75_EHRCJ|nr:metallophosphoesterase [Ehrlichia canis]AAZ68209.1 Metallophosphoesterase [Ehrlichia canis str. Jake]AUO55026.1 metallophosphoesterase [Ehrlichia canis]UKC53165.1 metallophosphoesterase [Ehrlichia canis]UKC54102.1 metallophosphoesterase [Ehrlichia canis]UKC55038.1 metallophosphoesterase [Ehrlichia canis]